MVKGTVRSYVLLIVVSAVSGVAVWAALRFTTPKQHWFAAATNQPANFIYSTDSDRWAQAVAKAKEDRTQDANANVALEVPSELRHYEDRHWFLATQVAEVKQNSIQNCQDFLDVAAMISRGDLVSVPVVTDDYVLLGVGARADQDAFTRYEDDQPVAVYGEAQLADEYQRLANLRTTLQTEIARLKNQIGSLKSSDRAKRNELQKQVSVRQQDLDILDERKSAMDKSYGQADQRQKLFKEYESLQTLAKNFRGRSYDLGNPTDREALKVAMLSSIRPAALKILEEVASAYSRQFNRPLPVSSLVRPEEYQHTLRRYNRAAVLIDTPPHSTGLAFDIDYRYMSVAEQNFVMNYLAQLKRDGRIEVLRERGANFHVFAFIDGVRPNDDLIRASLADVDPSLKDAGDSPDKPADVKKSKAAPRQSKLKSKAKGPSRSKSKPRKRR
jgi:Family of unknown function (DUF5715)